jgi:glycosyltransferase involved in cell wall biosynthesis
MSTVIIQGGSTPPAPVRDFPGLIRRVREGLTWRGRRLRNLPHDLWLHWIVGRFARTERPQLEQARARHEREYERFDNPLVSVLIPTYNRGKLLVERTLPSVFSQTYQNFEIIVVGDCCPDDTPQRLAEVKDPRFRFFNLPERGKYPSDPLLRWKVAGSVPSNKALDMARGQWIAYLDDDDVFPPNHLERLLEVACQGNYELVYGRLLYERGPGEWVEDGGPVFPRGRWRFGKANVPHSAVLYRSYLRFFKYYLDAWRYGLPTDNLLWQRMGRAGVRAAFIHEVMAIQPLRPGEAMRTPDAVNHERAQRAHQAAATQAAAAI